MDLHLQGLLHNKWAVGGVVVAAGAGLFVFLRKRAAGGGATSSTGAQASPAYAGGVGGFDSTGTDVAAQLGQWSANTQVQLDQYQQQLTSALAGLAQVPSGTTGTGVTTSTAVSAPAAAMSAAPGPQLVSVGAGANLYDFADANVPGSHTAGQALDQLRALNPNLNGLISWQGSGTKAPIITKGLPLRVS